MKKIIIDPKFEFLRKYISDIPNTFDSNGSVLENKRNVIRETEVHGLKLVIKSFRRIYLPNRIRYSFFYPSKAQRAFDYAKILLKKGIRTPQPIGYIEVKRYGLIHESFFISDSIDFTPLQVGREEKPVMTPEFMIELARFTYKLHQSNIYHVDYSLGNILFKKIDGAWQFALVDNNRMTFGPVSFHKGIRALVKLTLPVEFLTWIGKEYARLRKVNEIIAVAALFQYKRRHMLNRQMKGSMKGIVAHLKSIW